MDNINLLTVLDRVSEEDLEASTDEIQKVVTAYVQSEAFDNAFPDQELIYFNNNGFDMTIVTILKRDKENYDKTDEELLPAFPKITYILEVNKKIEITDETQEVPNPFSISIAPDDLLNLSDNEEIRFLTEAKKAIIEIICIILKVLYSKINTK